MQFIRGVNRNQVSFYTQSLDDTIDQDNEVRLIDLFIESIELSKFDFITKTSIEGRPTNNPKDLLRLYIYGYLNSTRSSRVLKKECKRNNELVWLMKGLAPEHNTISNFRRDNEKAIEQVFRYTVGIAEESDVGLLFTAYNLRRMMNIIDKNKFKRFLKELAHIFSQKTILGNVFCMDLSPSNLNTQLFASLFKAA